MSRGWSRYFQQQKREGGGLFECVKKNLNFAQNRGGPPFNLLLHIGIVRRPTIAIPRF